MQHHLVHKLRVKHIFHFLLKDACQLHMRIYDILDKFLTFAKVYIFSAADYKLGVECNGWLKPVIATARNSYSCLESTIFYETN